MARLKVDWSRKNTTDVDPTIRRFERWLNEHGYREACVETYVGAVRKFLVVAKSANSTLDDAMMWHGDLAESKLARSTVNIWSAALKAFYRSIGMELTLPHLKVNNKIPYFFHRRRGFSDLQCHDQLKTLHYAQFDVLLLTASGRLDKSGRRRYRHEDHDLAYPGWQVREICNITNTTGLHTDFGTIPSGPTAHRD